ncbi:Spy/CpxP family protein refolding chaperone [Thermodesulfobacteriota bacterium]
MKTSVTSKALMIITIVAVIGFGAYAFAGWGMGYGHHGRGHYGPDGNHEGWGGPGYGHMMDNLSDAEIEKMENERNTFFKATENLRQDLYAKELELKTELYKENPDTRKAVKLQKELSNLEAKLDQERIDHMVKMRKINPDAGRGFMGRGPMGYGPSYGGYCGR